MIELLTAMEEIERDFATVGESDVRRVQRNLDKILSQEKPLGALHSDAVKRLWALAERYEVAGKQAALDAAHKTDTEEQREALMRSAMRLCALERLVRDLFWIQSQDDIGDAAWGLSNGAVGVRADWMLVYVPSPPQSFSDFLGKILHGREE